MTTEPVWERVNDNTERLPVPGGWLYRVQIWREEWVRDDDHRYGSYQDKKLLGMTTTFVPGPGDGTAMPG